MLRGRVFTWVRVVLTCGYVFQCYNDIIMSKVYLRTLLFLFFGQLDPIPLGMLITTSKFLVFQDILHHR